MKKPLSNGKGSPLILEKGEALAELGDWSVFSETLPNIEVRVGAIYALERISQDSPRDHIQIMEILTAYIRENAPVGNLDPSEEPFIPARPRTDVQAALDVIGRRDLERIALEHSKRYRLDLREVDLSGANMSRGSFQGAIFFGGRFEATSFRVSDLRAARFQGSLLNYADFSNANLCGAILDRATITKFPGWNMSFMQAKCIRGLSMAGSDFSAINFLRSEPSHSPTFATEDTKLDYYILSQRKKLSEDIRKFAHFLLEADVKDIDDIRGRLEESGFLYWSPYKSHDLSTAHLRELLWDHLGLKGFPYRD